MADIAFDIIGRDRASAAFRSVGKSAKAADTSVSGFSKSLKSHVSRFAALTGASLGAGALLGLAKSSINTERAYSTSMRQIQAATGATGSQMSALGKQAIDLGQKTVFSANDSADAMLELGKAGMSAAQIMKAVPQVMNLAATEGMGLADAAGVVTSGLAEFGIKAKNSATLVNALAGASIASKGSVSGLAQSLSYVGGAAHGMGMSVQETSGALAALANHGQEGTVAGTALAAIFNHLQPKTKAAADTMDELGIKFVNANGSFKTMAQIAGILQGKLGKLAPAARQADIGLIFGRNAGTISAVNALVAEGAKGIEKYTKAASDQSAAEKLSAARMGGTAGAIEQMNGAIDTAKLKLGQALAPAVIKTANGIANHLGPAVDSAIAGAKDFGKILDGTVLPPLKIAGSLVLDVAKVFGDLPGPLKSVGIEAGIAALVFPRLSAGVTTATTAIKDQITFARVLRLEMMETASSGNFLSTAVTKMGGAIKMAAGVAGMVALSESAKTTNKELGILTSAAGGAAMGFAFGGNPLSAAIGGVAGALTGVIGALHKSNSAFRGSVKPATDYASSLDQITGAATRATRAVAYQALQQQGALVAANKLGIGQRTLVSALLGNKNALGLVNSAVRKASQGTRVFIDSSGQMHVQQGNLASSATVVASALGVETDQLKKDIAATRRKALATGNLSAVMKGVPRKISTKIVQDGAKPKVMIADLVRYIQQGKLVPKQFRTIIRATGIDTTAKDLMKLAKTSRTVQTNVQQNSKDTGSAWAQFFGQGISSGQPKVDSSLNGLVIQSSNGAKGRARAGGSGVGFNLSIGVGVGIGSGSSFVNNAATQIINDALAHMRAAAKTKSPSRKTMKIGGDLGAGLRLGLRATKGDMRSAGVELIESLVKGIDQHKVKVKDVLDKLTKYVSAQTSKIQDLTSKKNGIIDSVKGFSSSVFGATFSDAQGNERAGSIADLIAFQQQQRDNAAQLQSDVQTLVKDHLSNNLLQQMLDEGASGAANIHTLAGASSSQIALLNSLAAQTNAAASITGNALAGVAGFGGVASGHTINGDLAQAKQNEAVALAMAKEFRKVLREEKEGEHVYVVVDGHQLHTILLKERQRKRKGLGLG